VRHRPPGTPVVYRIDAAEAPLQPAVVARAIEHAAALWNDTGLVRIERSEERGTPLVLSWRRGEHDDCPGFGRGRSAAHTGRDGDQTFVHFDAGRTWNTGDLDLHRTAAHELGHVLGLGHTEETAALMHHDSRSDAPTAADLAGLRTLLDDADPAVPGDLVLAHDRAVALVVRGLAPVGHTDFGFFDMDGDGSDELLVWRTAPAGLGALLVLHFDAGPFGRPRLTHTAGPFVGLVPLDGETLFATGPSGRRWLHTRWPGGAFRTRRLDDAGLLVEPTPAELMALDTGSLGDGRRRSGDVDGDGRLEHARRP